MSITGLDKLEAWKKAKDFAVSLYREVLPLLPEEEKWGLNHSHLITLVPNCLITLLPNHLIILLPNEQLSS